MNRLVLYPDTFIWTNFNKGIVYNALRHKGFLFENNIDISPAIDFLNNPENLYALPIKFKDVDHSSALNNFIKNIVDFGCGEIICDNGTQELSIKPILKIQDDKHYYSWLYKQGINGEIINNIHSLILNVGSISGDNLVATQCYYPLYNNIITIDISKILNFIFNARISDSLSELSIVGGCTHIQSILRVFKNFPLNCPIRFYIPEQSINNNYHIIENINEFGNIEVMVRLSKMDCNRIEKFIKLHELLSSVTFLVEGEEDLNIIESICSNIPKLQYRLIPIYTGHNKEFISSILRYEVTDLLIDGPTKQEIFIHQTLNIFNFGKIFIMPNGAVKTNMLNEDIGCVMDSPTEIVYREISSGTSWLHTRAKSSCDKCEYQWLCPSPSIYERLFDCPLCSKAHD